MPSPDRQLPLTRRRFLLTSAGAGAALALASAPARATARPRPFGRYGSPAARLTAQTLYVDASGQGDFTSVRAAVTAATGSGWTLVIAPGTYRETVAVDVTRTGMTWLGAGDDPRDVVIVYDNAAGTKKPDGTPYGTAGSATFTSAAPGLTVRDLTLANDWLRADHPDITGTQAVAAYTYGDRTHFENVRLLAHQDTLFVETSALTAFDRQYFHRCYIEGDVDFV
ncbi:pectin esterase, partial [Streptomyces sp. ISL-14]|nr:pectin esterase [Streptomyces sp. ISL-14]